MGLTILAPRDLQTIMMPPIVVTKVYQMISMVFKMGMVLIFIGVFLLILVTNMMTFVFLMVLPRYMVSMKLKFRLRKQCHLQGLGSVVG